MKSSRQATEQLRHRWPVVGIIVGLLGLFGLGNSPVYAQSEIDPDHFDSPNTEPFTQTKTPASQVQSILYKGNFSLPYTVHCSGKKLPPGSYSISLSSNGAAAEFTLMRNGQIVEAGPLLRAEGLGHGRDALILGRGRKMSSLSAIHVAGSDFVFTASPEAEPVSDNRPGGIQTLPLRVQKE